MTTRGLAVRLALAGLVACAGGDAAAQTPFLLVPQQELAFGQVTPGVPAVVSPTDVARRAELRLQGQGTVSLVITLPGYLEDAAGHRIPLVFSAIDGMATIKNRTVRFNPAGAVEIRMNPSEPEARVYLGGTALPGTNQLPGRYTATITVLVVPTGA